MSKISESSKIFEKKLCSKKIFDIESLFSHCPIIQQHLNLHQQIQFQQFVEFLDGLEVLGSEKMGQNFYKIE